MSAFDHLGALDRALVAKGFPAMSRWWRHTLESFYRSGRRQLVLRVGRRGGKSSSLCRVAVLEALYGEHKVPPGDIGVVAIVSVSRDEANQRLRTIKAILDALGIAYRPVDGGIELAHKAIAFKVFAASISGVSGPTCICAICDEVAKWKDADTGANPAKEVLASLRPTMATQPLAKMFLSSSPLGSEDAHATAYAAGETSFQCAAYAATWEANPSVTEQETHDLEPDDRIWRREYLAIPQASVLAAFDPDAVERAFVVRTEDGDDVGNAIVVIDASSGRKDAWTWGVAQWVRPTTGSPYLEVLSIDGTSGPFWKTLSSASIVARIAGVARTAGATTVHGDQREAFTLRGEFQAAGVMFIEHTWSASSKPRAVEQLRALLRDDAIAIAPHERMRKEMLAFEEKLTAEGRFTFGARGSAHDDYVTLLLTAMMAHEAGHLRMPDGDEHGPQEASVQTATPFGGVVPSMSAFFRGGDF